MEQGSVKGFSDAKGFGFLSRPGGDDVYAFLGNSERRPPQLPGRAKRLV